ncbi:MAG: EamA family transporter [Candidatus Bathyarchaeota archaeon]|nr:EamA family transporter [Candidatus Bathyarchaeota archaeon]
MESERTRGLLEALVVTFLWSSSYILTKFGLTQVSPLTLVSLRYIVASLVLIPLAVVRGEHRKLDTRTIMKLVYLGVAGYSVAQGLQVLGLYYLPAVTVTFLLNFTPVTVIALNMVFFKEKPSIPQIGGVALVIAGAYIYFGGSFTAESPLGVAITLVSGLGWAFYMVSSRVLFKERVLSPLGATAFTMGFGTVFIAASAILFEGLRQVPSESWLIILWLGIVNTAAAFFLWNRALQKVEAFEISILQNTMLIQIAILSLVFLGETLTPTKILGMTTVFIGVLVVQVKKITGEDSN